MFVEVFGWALIFAAQGLMLCAMLIVTIGFLVWQAWGTWFTPLKMSLLTAIYLLIVAFIASHPTRLRKALHKYGPHGVLPWCLSCDADLRGNLKRDKSGRIQKRCGNCGTPVFEYRVD